MKNNFMLKTDILPSEIPINFTNKNLFMIDKKDIMKNFTIPYTFQIPKPNSLSRRIMSLPHPIAQLQMKNFINDFKFNITGFCSLSPYSIRSPQKINSINTVNLKRKLEKINYQNEQFFNIEDKIINTITYNDIIEEYGHFFKYKKYSFLDQFLNSPIYNRTKSRFDSAMKLDIQNFFGSIYTHSLEWAVIGDKYVVKAGTINNKDDDFFHKAIDNVCQKINHNETNGIIIGPEFSRLVAEVLLTRIDLSIYKELYSHNIKYNQDYILYRYVDDYFIFFNNTGNTQQKIEAVITDNLKLYKLVLNENKSITANSTKILEDTSIIILKKNIHYLFEKYNNSPSFNNRTKYINDFLAEFDHLITNYPEKKLKLVRYSLKTFNNFINSKMNNRDYKLIFELVLYIYNHSPEYYSTRYFYTFFLKYREFFKKNNLNEIEILMLEEDIFEFMLKALKQNSKNFNLIYELIIAMKFIDKKITPSILVSLIEKNYYNYYSLCSIAIYILDKNKKISNHYIIVLKKILLAVDKIFKDYTLKSKFKFQDAFYFYIVNDFYYYPGFKSYIAKKSFQNLNKNFKSMKEEIKREGFSQIETNLLTNRSYFNWEIDFRWFFKKAILKSENISYSTTNNDY